MADKPTIEEVAAAKAFLQTASQADLAGSPFEALVANIRTLLASHASLEERVKEAKRLMRPFAEAVPYLDYLNLPNHGVVVDAPPSSPAPDAEPGWILAGHFRALAAFVNEKERT